MICLENIFLKADVLISETACTWQGLQSSIASLRFPPFFPSVPSPRTRRCNSSSCSCLTTGFSNKDQFSPRISCSVPKVSSRRTQRGHSTRTDTSLFLLLSVPELCLAVTPDSPFLLLAVHHLLFFISVPVCSQTRVYVRSQKATPRTSLTDVPPLLARCRQPSPLSSTTQLLKPLPVPSASCARRGALLPGGRAPAGPEALTALITTGRRGRGCPRRFPQNLPRRAPPRRALTAPGCPTRVPPAPHPRCPAKPVPSRR